MGGGCRQAPGGEGTVGARQVRMNNERVLTKIDTPVRLYNTKTNRFKSNQGG